MDPRSSKEASPARPKPCGVLVVDKPKGPTSHDVVARMRRLLATREVGHAGTLDPMATGALVVAVGEATKLVPYLIAQDKAYEATVCFGIETATLDAEGEILARMPLAPSLEDAFRGGDASVLAEAADAERLRTAQVPPAFSAIKIDGERAHERARRGDAVELAPRPVEVRRLDVVEVGVEGEAPWARLRLIVSKGYYVRSLARDLAAALGSVGHLTALRRTRSGAFAVDAKTLRLAPTTTAEEAHAALLSLAEAARMCLVPVTLDPAAVAFARVGKPVPAAAIANAAPGAQAWFDEQGALVAIGERTEAGEGRVLRGIAP